MELQHISLKCLWLKVTQHHIRGHITRIIPKDTRPYKKDNLGHSQNLILQPSNNSHTVCSIKFLHFSSSSIPSVSHYVYFFTSLFQGSHKIGSSIYSDSSRFEPLGQNILHIIRMVRNMVILIDIVLPLKIRPEQIFKRFLLILVKLPFQNWHCTLLDTCRFTSLLLTQARNIIFCFQESQFLLVCHISYT